MAPYLFNGYVYSFQAEKLEGILKPFINKNREFPTAFGPAASRSSARHVVLA